MNEHIETHPDFRLTNNAIHLIDPEVREEGTMSVEQMRELYKKADEPIRDFVWSTSDARTRISQMSPEFLLVVARHCVHRANVYYERVNFFMNVLSIVEEHAQAKGLEVPSTVEEIQEMIEQLKAAKQAETEQDLPITITPSKEFTDELHRRIAKFKQEHKHYQE